MNWNNYECDGQMSIFDFVEEIKPRCALAKECEVYPDACGGTIQECRFGGPFKWSTERIGKNEIQTMEEELQKETRLQSTVGSRQAQASQNGKKSI